MFKLKYNVPEDTVIFRVDTGDGFWGLFLEYGTRVIQAKPFFRPAIDANIDHISNEVKQKLAKGIESEAKKLARGKK